MAEAEPSFDTVIAETSAAADLLKNADVRVLPSDVRAKIEPLLATLPSVRQDLEQLRGLFGTLADLTGANGARRFALVFQNPNEMRPTGGFMGQFALIKVDDGRVERLDLKSIYDASGQVVSRRTAPEGLNVVSETFTLHDANWYPEFSRSTEALLSFFAETGDPNVDGVIALNPEVINNVLAVTGPLDLPNVDLRVSEDNFVEEAQYEVAEKDPARDRAFFPSFAQALFTRLLNLERDRWPELFETLLLAVMRKDMQLHFETPRAQELAENLGVSGQLPPTNSDALALVYANIGGGKTDAFIEETRSLKIEVEPQVVRHELTVTRKDTRTDQYKDKQNRQYVRLYVPKDAQLESAEGFDADIKQLVSYACEDCTPDPQSTAIDKGRWEPISNTRIYEEDGRAVFANWLKLGVGEERTFRVTYAVPRSSLDTNGFVVALWRQPGADDIPVHVDVGAQGQLQHVTNATISQNRAALDLVLDRDRVVGILAP